MDTIHQIVYNFLEDVVKKPAKKKKTKSAKELKAFAAKKAWKTLKGMKNTAAKKNLLLRLINSRAQ